MTADPAKPSVTPARVMDYAPPDPLWTRLRRLIPRFRLLTWLLLPATIALVAWFWQNCGVWTLQEINCAPGEEPEWSAVFQPSPDERQVAVGMGHRLRVIEIPTGRCVLDDNTPNGDCRQFVFSRDGRRLVCQDSWHAARLYNMDTGKSLAEFACVNLGTGLRGLCLTEDGTRLVVWTPTGVALWDAQAGTKLRYLEPRDPISSDRIRDVQVTNDQRMAVVLDTARVSFYRLADGTLDHSCPIRAWTNLAVFHDGSAVAAACWVQIGLHWVDQQLHIIDTSTGTDRFPPLPIGTQVSRVEMTRDGNRIVVVDGGGIRLIDAHTGRLIKMQPAHWLGPAGHDFQQSPDWQWLVLPVDQRAFPGSFTVREAQLIFDARTLDLTAAVPGHPPDVWQPFSHTSRMFLALPRNMLTPDLTVFNGVTWKPESKINAEPRLQNTPLLWYRADGTILTAHATDLNLWRRHRPAAWYGVAVLPQFWLALLALALLTRSVWRDLRWWYSGEPATSTPFSILPQCPSA